MRGFSSSACWVRKKDLPRLRRCWYGSTRRTFLEISGLLKSELRIESSGQLLLLELGGSLGRVSKNSSISRAF